MATLSVSLPAPLKEFVENETSKRNFATASEYIRSLIRQEQKRALREEIETKLLEAEGSPSTLLTPESWEEIKAEARRRAGVSVPQP